MRRGKEGGKPRGPCSVTHVFCLCLCLTGLLTCAPRVTLCDFVWCSACQPCFQRFPAVGPCPHHPRAHRRPVSLPGDGVRSRRCCSARAARRGQALDKTPWRPASGGSPHRGWWLPARGGARSRRPPRHPRDPPPPHRPPDSARRHGSAGREGTGGGEERLPKAQAGPPATLQRGRLVAGATRGRGARARFSPACAPDGTPVQQGAPVLVGHVNSSARCQQRRHHLRVATQHGAVQGREPVLVDHISRCRPPSPAVTTAPAAGCPPRRATRQIHTRPRRLALPPSPAAHRRPPRRRRPLALAAAAAEGAGGGRDTLPRRPGGGPGGGEGRNAVATAAAPRTRGGRAQRRGCAPVGARGGGVGGGGRDHQRQRMGERGVWGPRRRASQEGVAGAGAVGDDAGGCGGERGELVGAGDECARGGGDECAPGEGGGRHASSKWLFSMALSTRCSQSAVMHTYT